MRILTDAVRNEAAKSGKQLRLPLRAARQPKLRKELPAFCHPSPSGLVRQSLAYDLRTQQTETVAIVEWIILRRSVIEFERLFVYIAEQVEQLNRNVCAAVLASAATRNSPWP